MIGSIVTHILRYLYMHTSVQYHLDNLILNKTYLRVDDRITKGRKLPIITTLGKG
jgi:hypothetical protein